MNTATRLRNAAEYVDRTAVRNGLTDDYEDNGDGMVEVSIEAMESLRDALIACMGKPEFYDQS